jgi:hypothetical protein
VAETLLATQLGTVELDRSAADETVLMPAVVAPTAPTATTAATAAAPVPAVPPPTPAPAGPALIPSNAGPAWGAAPTRRRAVASRRSAGAAGILIVLLAVAIVAVAGVVLAGPLLEPGPDGGGLVADTSRSPRAVRSPSASAPAAAGSTPEPTAAPTSRATLEATVAPTTQPTAAPTPERTRRPRPQPSPTARPTAAPTPAPPAPPETERLRIPDRWFRGDYEGEQSGRYHGRSASWVYGQGTRYHTMTARFDLDHDGTVVRRASLQLVGLDGDDPDKHPIVIELNGVTIFEGPNPLPNDECCGPDGPGNWGSFTVTFPGDLLERRNALMIRNLEPSGCTLCPDYVMVDYGVLSYRVRP